MSKTSLIEAFNIERKKPKFNDVSDYEVFPDKKLLDELRVKIVENLIDQEIPEDKLLQQFINDEIDKSIEGYDLTNLERSHLYNLIDNEINGYGPLTELLEDKNITEIMVNSPKEIYIEIDGQLIKDESVSFINDEHIIRTIERMIGPMGRTIDATNPMVDSRLKDGSRINAVIPPLSTKGPIITIRKFKKEMTSADDMIRIGSMTPYMATFLEAAVKGKCNIIICGGTGSGKTTLLNILSSFIPDNERIITIEDAAELKLEKEHVISLETRVTNYDNEGEITIRDLVINALRMRPDRIVVGEVRGGEAVDMLQALNTGHDGSLSTAHANSAEDMLSRLETMTLMGVDLPLEAIRRQIASGVDILIHLGRMRDKSRKVLEITEVCGFENHEIKTRTLYRWQEGKGLVQTAQLLNREKLVRAGVEL